MTTQLAVILAVKALVTAAIPAAKVTGFDGETTKPTRRDPGGNVIGHPGDPGEPDVDLSPLTFIYRHRVFLELAAPEGTGAEVLDAMIAAVGEAIVADRTLGGLCDWVEALAPDRNDRSTNMIATASWAVVPIDIEYSTSDPLA